MCTLFLVVPILFAAQDDPVRRARELVEKLRSDKIEERDEAAKSLKQLGSPAERELEKASTDSPDAEVRSRASEILEAIRRARTIKVVSSLPRTGSAGPQTDSIVKGIRLAFEEAGWKVGDSRIEYEDRDSAQAAGGWRAELEAVNAARAVGDPQVMVYIGTYNSGAAKVSMPVLNRAGIVMISPANTYPGLTKPGMGDDGEPACFRPSGKVNYCRVVPADDIQGDVGADWAKKLGLKKVYVLDDRETYGKGIAERFMARAGKIGLTVLGHEGIDPEAKAFAPLMDRIKAEAPDLIYFGGTTQTRGGQIARDIVAAKLTAKLMVPDGCFEEAFIESAGPASLNDWCYLTFGGLLPEKLTGKGKAFVRDYVKKHGKMPEAYAVYGYESAKVALEGIRRAGRLDRNAIRAACLSIKDFEGTLGKWSFDANGDTTLTAMSGYLVKNGKFEFVETLQKGE